MGAEEGARQVVLDLCAGSVGGAAGIVAGQPLDLIKVRAQTDVTHKASVAQVLRQTVRHEGVPGLFKGMLPPVLGQVVYTSLAFAGYNWTLERLDGPRSSARNIFVAGTAAGALTTLATTPFELIKCNLQVDRTHSGVGGVRRVIRQRLHAGGVQGLYTGFGVTLLRDAPATGWYFLVYFRLKEQTQAWWGASNHVASELFSGGVAGVACWAPVIPIDVVKSRMQTDAASGTRTYAGALDCARKIVAKEGMGGFYKGAVPLLLRAFPVSAVTFLVYERVFENAERLTRPATAGNAAQS